jgi:exopolysaccharide biosynthesis glucuronosyltransferase PssE
MILVTVGTNEAAFDRLILALDRIPPGEEIVAQCGSSLHRPARAACFDFLPFEELTQLVRRARFVVTHAGAGSTMVALANGKRPIVVPRLRRYGEAVDDHQLHFARRLAEGGLVMLAEDPERLPEVLAVADGSSFEASVGADERLVEELRLMITAALAPTGEGRGAPESRSRQAPRR